MNESVYQKIRDTAWQRRLTRREEIELAAQFASHPDEQTAWDEERRLTQLLHGLPDAPVASNFTAQVMQAVNRDLTGGRRVSQQSSWWTALLRRNWPARAATALVLMAVGLFGQQQLRISRRLETARSLAVVSPMAGSQDVEVWNDFDAILRLGQLSTQVDTDLLKALQ